MIQICIVNRKKKKRYKVNKGWEYISIYLARMKENRMRLWTHSNASRKTSIADLKSSWRLNSFPSWMYVQSCLDIVFALLKHSAD